MQDWQIPTLILTSLFFHRACCYRTLFKIPTLALCFKIHIKTQSPFKTLECLRLLCHHTCFGHKLDHLQGKTGIGIAFRASNTIYQQLVQKIDNKNPSGIYEIKCNTCGMNYVGQSGRPLTTRYKEHVRYIIDLIKI